MDPTATAETIIETAEFDGMNLEDEGRYYDPKILRLCISYRSRPDRKYFNLGAHFIAGWRAADQKDAA